VEALRKLSTDIVEVQFAHSGVGAITETDVNLAMATGSVIIVLT
jgi:translation initiation factor IF-2